MNYKNKYLKYKNKYISSKTMIGGVTHNILDEENYDPNQESNNDFTNFKHLFGPVTYYVLQNENKTIYLFGDYHLYNSNVDMTDKIYLPDYLNNLFSNYSNSQFDMFIELPYTNTKQIDEIQHGLIDNIRMKFNECFNNLIDKKQCENKYKNVRFHATDLRFYYRELDNTVPTFFNILTIRSNLYNEQKQRFEDTLQKLRKGEVSNNDYLQVLNEFYNQVSQENQNILGKDEFKKSLKLQLENVDKVAKHLNNDDLYKISNDYVDVNIDTIYYDYLMWKKQLLLLVEKKDLLLEFINSDLLKRGYDSLEKLQGNFIHAINAFKMYVTTVNEYMIMDIYTIFRTMRCDAYNPRCKNLIIIAGNGHIIDYVNFYKSIGFEIKDERVCKPIHLVNEINKIKDPEGMNSLAARLEKIAILKNKPELRYIDITKHEIEQYIKI